MRVLCLLAPGFEEIEAVTVIDLLRRAGILVVTASIAEKSVCGSHNITITADAVLDEVLHEEFDACFLPGGQPGTRNLANDDRVIALIKSYHHKNRFVTAICAAPTVLLKAGILSEKLITAYPTEKERFDPACYREEDVVRDGNIITGRAAGAAIPFALRLVESWQGREAAKSLAGKIVFRP